MLSTIQQKNKSTTNIEKIEIHGARQHNLKNISVSLPRNKMIVITGLSGSGKSSLAFDTLFAEGRRRYVESLSAYARQFLGRLDKPDVDNITGISPAIAIEQKSISNNPRSTVGTTTGIYDYLRILFARIGHTFSPVSGEKVKKNTVSDVLAIINSYKSGTKIEILSQISCSKIEDIDKKLKTHVQQGFSRLWIDGKIIPIEEAQIKCETYYILIDRVTVNKIDEDNNHRITDSIQSAFFEGKGVCAITNSENKKIQTFSNLFELDGILFEEPTPNFFSFNTPLGACKTCEGFGNVIGIDKNLVIPNKGLSLYEDAVICWRGEKMSKWKERFILKAEENNFSTHKPIRDLTQEQNELLFKGNKRVKGIDAFFKYVESKQYKIQYRVMLSRYRGKTSCPDCNGTRIRKDADFVKISGKNISELLSAPISELHSFFQNIQLSENEQSIAKRLLLEINNLLDYLDNVGLGYLTLNRSSATLSGGEAQRINLATSLGSSLVGSMYILDEPSIGLHPKDTQRLIKILHSLRDIGNTVIVVEHDEEIMRASDFIIDMGPEAGTQGGSVIFAGEFNALANNNKGLTSAYLNGIEKIEIPSIRRKSNKGITIVGAAENNLKNINVRIPLNSLAVITGVSGSGKSTLLRSILYPALTQRLGGYGLKPGNFNEISGDISSINAVEFIDQHPIGKSSRSNPVTYVKAFDDIRNLFALKQASKISGFKPKHFSFNVDGGRCETCQGEGVVTVEMQFMADIHLTCDVCNGHRFKDEVLLVKHNNRNISDVLNMTVSDAIKFFAEGSSLLESKIVKNLQPLENVGLGYITLGQSSNTLSGGEAQRIKLASFLGKEGKMTHTLFIFDEPTTGLHFHDIKKLLVALNALIARGNSILIIEHNPEIIKNADWVIDLGPEGGDKGGTIMFEGTPEDLIKCKKSVTGQYLKNHF